MQNDFRNGLCVKHLIGKVVLHQFLGPFSFEVHFQYDHRWRPSLIKMFGLVKIQEMIPGNKHILLKTSFSCEMQQVIWVHVVYGSKQKKNEIGRWRPSWVSIFRLIKIQKWWQKSALYATFSSKSDITRFLWPFTFKLHFQYGRRRPSWIFMVGLVKMQKRGQKWILHAKISRKSGITQHSMSICFQDTFPIWPPAAILDFGFSRIPPPFSRGSWGLNFF